MPVFSRKQGPHQIFCAELPAELIGCQTCHFGCLVPLLCARTSHSAFCAPAGSAKRSAKTQSAQTLLYENASCEGSDQGAYLGTPASVDECAVSAAAAGCDMFMFSESYGYAWGCRCCSAKTQYHNNWSIYSVDSKNSQRTTPRPTPRPRPPPDGRLRGRRRGRRPRRDKPPARPATWPTARAPASRARTLLPCIVGRERRLRRPLRIPQALRPDLLRQRRRRLRRDDAGTHARAHSGTDSRADARADARGTDAGRPRLPHAVRPHVADPREPVLQGAIAGVAGVPMEAVRIIAIQTQRRHLRRRLDEASTVVVDYEIEATDSEAVARKLAETTPSGIRRGDPGRGRGRGRRGRLRRRENRGDKRGKRRRQ